MKKILEVIRIIVYYALLFVASSLGIGILPIGAIAMLAATYAGGGILAPAIILSAVSISFFIGYSALIPFAVFILLFLLPVIFIRPLESIEGRNERKKVGNYVIFASFFSYIFFGFLEGIFSVILTYGIYKMLVNLMAVIRNEDEKLIFSIEENIGITVLLSSTILLISSYFNIPLIYSSILIAGILGYMGIKKGIIETLISYIFTILIYLTLITPAFGILKYSDISFNPELAVLLFLPILTFLILSILRRHIRLVIYITLSLFNLLVFFIVFKYTTNQLYYLPYLFATAVILIFVKDNEKGRLEKEKNSHMISDEGETRLQTEEKYIIKQDIIKTRDIVELYNDKDNFLNRMYTREEQFSELSLYGEIKDSDMILEEIYFHIENNGYIDRLSFNKTLIKNNIVVDIHSYEIEEELRVLEMLALRELKDIVRIREEKEVLKERELALQNGNNPINNIEETNIKEYNISSDNNVKKSSIRDLNKDKKDKNIDEISIEGRK